MRTTILFLLILLAGAASGRAAEPVCRAAEGEYLKALCLYHGGRFEEAEKGFRAVVEADAPRPETLKARYFLVRTLMKLGRWSEASEELIKIYSLSSSFYDEWSGDYLLGEIRRAQGLD